MLHQSVVEQRSTNFERDSHACTVHLRQNVVEVLDRERVLDHQHHQHLALGIERPDAGLLVVLLLGQAPVARAGVRAVAANAGRLAGLNVRAVLNEPTAAAIAYGLEQDENQKVLVYDLGGGTFDVTMIEIKDRLIRVICTGGDHRLGGTLWDEAVKISGADGDYHRRDLWEAITKGKAPEWDLGLQVFDQRFADSQPYDVLDATKLIPEEDVPLTIVGRLVLESVRTGRKPVDWNAESLAKFAPEFTPDVAVLLDPREGMKTREIAGGTGPETVAEALVTARIRLANLQ